MSQQNLARQLNPKMTFSFLHLSDLHLLPEVDGQVLGQTHYAKARAALQMASTLEIAPKFVLITGDLAHREEIGSYELLKTLISDIEAQFGVPVLLGVGNHDDRGHLRAVIHGQTANSAPYFYSQRIAVAPDASVRVIMLDTQVTGKTRGEVSPEQLAWLGEQLAQSTERDTILALHHAPLPVTIRTFQPHQLSNAAALAAVIAPYADRVLGLLHGHIHYAYAGVFAGVLCASAAGTAFTLDPTSQSGLRIMSGCGFNVVHVIDGQMLVDPIMLPGEVSELKYDKVPFD